MKVKSFFCTLQCSKTMFRDISFFTGSGASICGEDQNFGGVSKGGPVFFSVCQRGILAFFEGHRGGLEFFSKMGTLDFCAFGAISYQDNYSMDIFHNNYSNQGPMVQHFKAEYISKLCQNTAL